MKYLWLALIVLALSGCETLRQNDRYQSALCSVFESMSGEPVECPSTEP